MNEQDFSKIFEAQKREFPDEGFSERVFRNLPERKSLLPQIVMAAFVMLGLSLLLATRVFDIVLEQVGSLFDSIVQMQVPSASAVIIYLGLLGMVGLIAYSIMQADAE